MGSAAIVGAGMAGLACAAELVEAGWRVALFDKGRHPGGRMSSKTVRAEGLDFAFDYGAQYMTVRDPGFVEQVRAWEGDGVTAPWPVMGEDSWVGVPGMSAILAHMAEPLAPRWSTHIRALTRDDDGWHLDHDGGREGPFDAVVLALPAEQVLALAGQHAPELAALAMASSSAPCWTVLLGFDTGLPAPDRLDAAGPIDFAARNGAKPGRHGGEAWTIHATADWSRRHLESDAAGVTALLLRALEERVGTLPTPVHAAAHRWRYARSARAGIGAYHAPAIGLAACGDWLLAPRVESAWLSGRQAAEMMREG
jgi:predicted NAD/FAD-dependent oxidoreductase